MRASPPRKPAMFIARPGAQLHALSFGDGPLTLLAVGGWIAGGEIWLPVIGSLPRWRCIALDHRGSGTSVRRGPITLENMAEDVIAVADAMGARRCVLAAESAGAAVALRAAQRAPQRFAGLVLTGAAWQRQDPGASDPFIAALRSDHAGTLRGFVDGCLPETDSPELRRWGLQMLMRSSLDDAIELLRCREHPAPATPASEDTWPTLPTLLVHGELDRIAPPQGARDLAGRIRGAELHLLPGLGHVPLITAPAEVAGLIERFGWRLLARD